MPARSFRSWPVFLFVGAGLLVQTSLRGQDAAPPANDAPPAVPKGVEVLARGPVHEAFATLTAEAQPTKVTPKKPPKAIEEMPPDEKPEGDALWISGYWAWDDDRSDFLWVSGLWRTPPPGKQWVAGYWRDEADGAQWVPGFWTPVAAKQDAPQDVTYYPKPPDPPKLAAPGPAPAADTFYIPGTWVWNGTDYAWRAGYWARIQPNYVWTPAHYRWTPGGYIYIAGYWDYTTKRRGVLYAPVYIDTAVVGATFVYTPAYAVPDTVVVDALFVRPCTCHYYFGDYYDVTYRDSGFTSCVVYSQTNYDSFVVYQRYEHREDPTWINIQIGLSDDRYAGRAPVPARTLNQQNTIIQNTTVVNQVTNVNNVNNVNNNFTNVSTNVNNVTVNKQVMKTPVLVAPSKVMAAQGVKVVKLDAPARQQVQQQSAGVQQAALQRTTSEVAAPGGPPKQPHVAALNVAPSHPVAPKTATTVPTVGTQSTASPVTTAPTAKPVQPSVAPTPQPTNPAVTSPATPATSTHVTPAAPPTTPTVTTKPTMPVTPPTTPTVTTKPTMPTALPPGPAVSPPSTSVTTTPLAVPPGPGVTPLHPAVPPGPPPAKRPPPPPAKDKDKDKQHS